MNYGQSTVNKAGVDPFPTTIAAEVLPNHFVLKEGEDFTKGCDPRWGQCLSNTRVEHDSPVINLQDTDVATVSGKSFTIFFPDVSLDMPGCVREVSASINVVSVNSGLSVLLVDN